MTAAPVEPSPKTTCVALQYRSHPRHLVAASRSCGSECLAGRKFAALPVFSQASSGTTSLLALPVRRFESVRGDVRRVPFDMPSPQQIECPDGRALAAVFAEDFAAKRRPSNRHLLLNERSGRDWIRRD